MSGPRGLVIREAEQTQSQAVEISCRFEPDKGATGF